MICVTVLVDKQGILCDLEVTGHAGFSNPGNDIVCASVSTLVHTSHAAMAELDGVSVKVVDNAVYRLSVVKKDGADLKELLGMSKFVITALTLIEYNYPKHVKITIKE